MKVVIIEDEIGVRDTLKHILADYDPSIQIVAEFEKVSDAVRKIPLLSFDLMLLDVQLKDGTGLDILRNLPKIDFKVIFVTAYSEYSLQALKLGAIDYVIKPIDSDELIEAIEKVDKDNLTEKIDLLLNNMKEKKKKIVLRTMTQLHFIDIEDICYCQSQSNYTNVYLKNGETLLISKVLKYFEEILDGTSFIRIHRSYFVNKDYIKRVDHKPDGSFATLKNDTVLPISNRKKIDHNL